MFIRQNDTGKIGIGPSVSISDGFTLDVSLLLSTADSARARLGDDTTVDISGYTWAAVTSMDGYFDLTLQTGITDTVGPMDILIEDVSLCLPISMRFYVVEETVYDALYATSAAGFLATSTLTVAEQSQGAPPSAPTAEEILSYLYTEWVRNKIVTDTSGTDFKKVFADNGTTVLYKKSLADSASILTVGEAETGP